MSFLRWIKALVDSRPRDHLIPESLFQVELSDSAATCRRPDGSIERVEWSELRVVVIETTDAGPMAPDAFWLLVGERGGCVIPQGATGEEQLLKRLQTLPRFDNKAVIEAMGCADNRRFLCWKKDDQ